MPRLLLATAVALILAVGLVPPAGAEPRIVFEQLLAGEPFAPGVSTASVQGACDTTGSSTISFSGSGLATGTYPGTFTESGTLTLGPQIGPPNPVLGNEFASGTTVDYTAQFEIISGDTRLTGTKRFLAPLFPGFCFKVTNQAVGEFASATGSFVQGFTLCSYDVTIHDPTGVFSAQGECDATAQALHLQGTLAQSGEEVARDAEGFTEDLFESTPGVPVTTPGHATGGGQIDHVPPGSVGAVTFSLEASSDGTVVQGRCDVEDGIVHVVCTDATTYAQVGNNAIFAGDATIDGVPTTYRIDVQDNGESGIGQDTFSITTDTGYSASGVLTQGDIEVHA